MPGEVFNIQTDIMAIQSGFSRMEEHLEQHVESNEKWHNQLIQHFGELKSEVKSLKEDVEDLKRGLEVLALKESSSKEYILKFFETEMPKLSESISKLSEKFDSTQKDIIVLAPVKDQIKDHEDRIRKVEESRAKFATMLSMITAGLSILVSVVINFLFSK